MDGERSEVSCGDVGEEVSLREQVAEQAERLVAQQKVIDDLERRRQIDELLLDADAVDLATARLLTEMAVADMETEDLEAAVDELRRSKPFLFTKRSAGSTAQAPRVTAPHLPAMQHAAAEAYATGHRRDLLRYLRLRRRSG